MVYGSWSSLTFVYSWHVAGLVWWFVCLSFSMASEAGSGVRKQSIIDSSSKNTYSTGPYFRKAPDFWTSLLFCSFFMKTLILRRFSSTRLTVTFPGFMPLVGFCSLSLWARRTFVRSSGETGATGGTTIVKEQPAPLGSWILLIAWFYSLHRYVSTGACNSTRCCVPFLYSSYVLRKAVVAPVLVNWMRNFLSSLPTMVPSSSSKFPSVPNCFRSWVHLSPPPYASCYG